MRTGNDEVINELLQAGILTADVITGDVYCSRINGRRGKTHDPIGVEKKGYLESGITWEGKRYWLRLHRVVFISHHGVPAEGLEVDHVNGRACDNRLRNLELVTHRENMRRMVKRCAAKRKAAC